MKSQGMTFSAQKTELLLRPCIIYVFYNKANTNTRDIFSAEKGGGRRKVDHRDSTPVIQKADWMPAVREIKEKNVCGTYY